MTRALLLGLLLLLAAAVHAEPVYVDAAGLPADSVVAYYEWGF